MLKLRAHTVHRVNLCHSAGLRKCRRMHSSVSFHHKHVWPSLPSKSHEWCHSIGTLPDVLCTAKAPALQALTVRSQAVYICVTTHVGALAIVCTPALAHHTDLLSQACCDKDTKGVIALRHSLACNVQPKHTRYQHTKSVPGLFVYVRALYGPFMPDTEAKRLQRVANTLWCLLWATWRSTSSVPHPPSSAFPNYLLAAPAPAGAAPPC